MNQIVELPRTIAPICPFFYQCGGCETQDVAYLDQVGYKERWLKQLFSDIAPESLWKTFLHSDNPYPTYFRNKIRFGLVRVGEHIYPSRHQKGSETADIAVDACFLQAPETIEIVEAAALFAERYNWSLYDPKTGSGWLKHLLIRQGKRTGEIMVSLVTDNSPLQQKEEWISGLRQFAGVTSLYQTLTWGRSNEQAEDVLLWGDPYIHETVGDFRYRISPQAFFQTNSEMVERLYTAIAETVSWKGSEVLWDLYAGSATIGIFLSPRVNQVLSIENNLQNIADAEVNCQLNKINSVEIVAGEVEKVLTSQFLATHSMPEVIVVDPPRAGLSERIKLLLPNIPKHELIYVSCNPLTCLRDCKQLIRSGYKLESLQGIDMFPHTLHCELIVHLRRPY